MPLLSPPQSPLVRGLLEMLAVVAAFVALGLVGQGAGGGAAAGGPPYPPAMARDAGTLYLVDGYNVLCSGVLGGRARSRWWAEERREELLARLAELDDPEAEIWVVFDGDRSPEAGPAGTADAPAAAEAPDAADAADRARVHAVFAPSADDWLVAEVRRRVSEARTVAVVTADRQVAGRSRHRGAQVLAPRELLGRCVG